MTLPELDDLEGRYVSVGDVVAGKYLVERVLGAGGMAFVLSARHLELDEQFALKFLNRNLLSERPIVERFKREARAACKIRSEHVARVHDVGSHEGNPFIVMEHLSGRDLATVLEDEGPLRLDDAMEFTIQTCEALAAAHALGIVHRDIKPENLFLVERDGVRKVKLLDFGISKIALTGGEASSRLTGQLSLGTPFYMSPEQIRSSASADAQSDLWSLAAVLYELLAGVQAFPGSTVTEVCAAVLESTPTPLSEFRGDVPPELMQVLSKALEKDRARRYTNVGELAMALVPFAPLHTQIAAERSSLNIRVAGAPDSGRFISSHTPTTWIPTSRLPQLEVVEDNDAVPLAQTNAGIGRRRSRMSWGIAAAAVLVIGGVAGARSLQSGTAAFGSAGEPIHAAQSGAEASVKGEAAVGPAESEVAPSQEAIGASTPAGVDAQRLPPAMRDAKDIRELKDERSTKNAKSAPVVATAAIAHKPVGSSSARPTTSARADASAAGSAANSGAAPQASSPPAVTATATATASAKPRVDLGY